ncbi:MAG: PaaI family thioesterase [Elusimicrobia bacterium]|nr:PaaI family thioesterase [Elusimicrobiota bacterium]
MELKDDGYCFACGMDNPYGLRLTWHVAGRHISTTFLPERRHQGYVGIVHGGILASLLDEAIGHLAWRLYGNAVSVEMLVRYHHMARVGESLRVEGEIHEKRNRLILASARIRDGQGTLLAETQGKVLCLP